MKKIEIFLSCLLCVSADARDWNFQINSGPGFSDVIHAESSYLASSSSGAIYRSSEGDNWAPISSTGVIFDLVYHDGTYVGVGLGIRSSGDGVTWEEREVGTRRRFTAVTYGAGRFVAVGAEGNIATSPDGVTWELTDSGFTFLLNDVHFADGLFVAGASGGSFLTSPDGLTWTTVETEASQGLGINAVNYAAGKFIATNIRGILTSDNGTDWEAQSVSGVVDEDIASNGDTIVITGRGGKCTTSTDAGETWTLTQLVAQENFATLESVVYGPQGFVIVGDGGEIFRSLDGLVWLTELNSGPSPGSANASPVIDNGADFDGFHFSDSIYVAAGGNGAIVTSTDLESWERRSEDIFMGQFQAVTEGGGTWVAVGDGSQIGYSTDTEAWFSTTLPEPLNLKFLAHGNGLFLAAGQRAGSFAKSADGVTWSVMSNDFNDVVRDLEFIDGQFALVVEEALYLSPDGESWTEVFRTEQELQTIAADSEADDYLISGRGAAFFTSTSLTGPWEERSLPFAEFQAGVAFRNGIPLIIAGGTAVYTVPREILPEVTGLTFERQSPDLGILSWDASSGADYQIWAGSRLENLEELEGANITLTEMRASVDLTLDPTDRRHFYQLRR